MSDPWYKAAFGPLYEDIYSHRNLADARRAVDFVRAHGVAPDTEPVLDLCCGAGRHSLQWARQGGRPPVGLDLSEHLIDRARRTVERTGIGLHLLRGDMRYLPFRNGAFRAVLNLFTSYGYFDDEAENQSVFHEVARVLAPGGRFVFDHIHPEWLRQHLKPETTRRTRTGIEIRERRRIDPKSRRVEKTIEFELDGEMRRIVESVRLYEPAEIEALGRSVDMELVGEFGDFDASPLGPESPRGLYVFRRMER